MSIPSHRCSALRRIQSLLLIGVLCGTTLTLDLGLTGRAWANGDDDDDPSTGEQVLGTFLGSADGALIARALTLREERTSTVTLLYAGAICGGATAGYLLAGNEDALTVMGIMLIPLVILNLALPSTNPYFETTPYLAGGPLAGVSRLTGSGGNRRSALPADTALPAGDWWKTALWNMVPQPAAHGARLTPLRVRF